MWWCARRHGRARRGRAAAAARTEPWCRSAFSTLHARAVARLHARRPLLAWARSPHRVSGRAASRDYWRAVAKSIRFGGPLDLSMPRIARLPDRSAWLVLVAVTSCLVVRLNAQQPELPPLANGADRNDWEAYYDAGVAVLHMDPRKADAAFAHASRIRPDRAEPLYARWIAFWALDLELFGKYIRGDEKTQRDPRVRQADSLRTRALWRNPFVHQGLILFLYDKLPGRFRDNAITRAWIALGQAELELALRRFGALIDRDPERYGYLRFVRASAFTNTNQQDSATAELTALLAQLRAADSTELVNYYESKELLEHALGLLHLHGRRVPLAQEAFGRAVAENAAFAPSHAMLGLMALAARDAA